ncbi:MAG: WXG100 family type VII secretion target [Hespellia sp.]|nr:WXG100 family type VII secretion target [Hespellia sp.]
MSEFRVSVQELKAKSDELRTLNSQFKSAVGELESTEANLASMWEGEAKNTFHNAFTSDKVQMDNFYNAIEVYVQKLDAIINRYIQAENNNITIANERKYK